MVLIDKTFLFGKGTTMTILSVNPATEEVIAQFEPHSDVQVSQILDRARGAFVKWRTVPLGERGAILRRVAGYLHANKSSLALLATQEMGKPISESEAEIEKCAWNCDYYAHNTGRFLAPEQIESSATESYVEFAPIGTVLAVMPWNFPFWQVFRFAAPALMAGNVALLKHASNVPRCALAIEEVFCESGFPTGAFRTLMMGSAAVEQI